jgi:catalase
MVGIVVDPDGDLDGLTGVRQAVFAANMVPLLIGPHGGKLPNGMPVQRTFLTGRSVEYDAVLLAGSPRPASDALASRDAKAGSDGAPTVDPRVQLLVEETFRHAKVIGAWGTGVTALTSSGCTADQPGVVTGDDPSEVFSGVLQLMGGHRVWDRFASRAG